MRNQSVASQESKVKSQMAKKLRVRNYEFKTHFFELG